MKKLIIIIAVIVSIGFIQHKVNKIFLHKNAAPGFYIVCDGKGHWSYSENPDGSNPCRANNRSSRQELIELTWYLYNSEHEPKVAHDYDTYNFKLCTQTNMP